MKNTIMLEVINQLGYDFKKFDLQNFIDHIQHRRQRDIILVPAVFGYELSAVWVRAETADYAFYNTTHHPIHQTHSILHELAHITLEHSCVPIDDILPAELLAELDISNPIGRPRIATPLFKDSEEERAAEEFVYVIQQQVINANRLEQLIEQGSSNKILNKYVSGMVK